MTNDSMEETFDNSLEYFQAAIDTYDNLEIVATVEEDGKDLLVIENSNVGENIEGHQTTVEVAELFAKVTDKKSAERFAGVVNTDRKARVCEGITRVVGYYSRTHNWNASKVGELRDRQNGRYGTPEFKKEHYKEACVAVDGL